jgi:Putative polyhydroxyalkanoic acid system protein (PHA_gran_rgn)
MSSIKLHIPHKLTEEEALGRIKTLLHKLKHEQKNKISNVKEEWSHNTGHFHFTAQGFDLSGVIKVHAANIDIHAKLPFAVSIFKSRIKAVILEKAHEVLAP